MKLVRNLVEIVLCVGMLPVVLLLSLWLLITWEG